MEQSQAAGMRSARRALYAALAIGFLSATLILLLLLPWQDSWTLYQKTGIGLTDGSDIVYSVAATWAVFREAELHRSEQLWAALLLMVSCAAIQTGAGIWLSVEISAQSAMWRDRCTPVHGVDSCDSSLLQLNILLPLLVAVLPLASIFVCYIIWRFLTRPDPFTFVAEEADVPPNWHVPPSHFAPDSSDSGGEESYEMGTSSSGFASPNELESGLGGVDSGKKAIDRSKWSKVRRSRRKQQQSGGYGRLAEM